MDEAKFQIMFSAILLLVGVFGFGFALLLAGRGKGDEVAGTLFGLGGVFIYLGVLGCSIFM